MEFILSLDILHIQDTSILLSLGKYFWEISLALPLVLVFSAIFLAKELKERSKLLHGSSRIILHTEVEHIF